jgi:hypothetical protein
MKDTMLEANEAITVLENISKEFGTKINLSIELVDKGIRYLKEKDRLLNNIAKHYGYEKELKDIRDTYLPEISKLEKSLSELNNKKVSLKEHEDMIVFLLTVPQFMEDMEKLSASINTSMSNISGKMLNQNPKPEEK